MANQATDGADVLAELTIITSSMRTRWEPWSQACLQRALPQCRRIVVEGRYRWDPLYFAEIAAAVSTKYFALVDEDCFVFDGSAVRAMLLRMESDSIDVAGPPDGGTFHRHLNPVACNTYFLLVRTEVARRVVNLDNWRQLRFTDLAADQVSRDHVQAMSLDTKRIDFSLDEPYYPFFWATLKLGFRIDYLSESLDRNLLASVLGATPERATSTPAIVHMWWLRSSAVRDIEPYLGVSHWSRYEKLLALHLRPAFSTPSGRVLLAVQQLRSMLRRMLGSIVRRLQ